MTAKKDDRGSRNPEEDMEERAAFGEWLSDRVSEFGGSWTFLTGFCAILVLWMTANALLLGPKPFDPYQFILLNLVLSCMAALQAPIILSQHRRDAQDRLCTADDYRVSLKSDLEIRLLPRRSTTSLRTNGKGSPSCSRSRSTLSRTA